MICNGVSLISQGILRDRAVVWLRRNIFDPESNKTLILCRLFDTNRKANHSGQSLCFGIGLNFVRLEAGPLIS